MNAVFPPSIPEHCKQHCLESSDGSEGDRIVCPTCKRVWKVKHGRWVHPSLLYSLSIEWWWLA